MRYQGAMAAPSPLSRGGADLPPELAAGSEPAPEPAPGAPPPADDPDLGTVPADFLETIRLQLSGGEPTKFDTAVGGCFLHLRYEQPDLEAASADFYEGRPLSDQIALGDCMKAVPHQDVCARVMLDFLERLAGVRGAPAGPGGPPKARSCGYYMLCDDEELGYDEAGNPDGDLRTRRACDEWRLVTFATADTAFVEFGGVRGDGTRIAEGRLSRLGGRTVSTLLYRIDDDEDGYAADPLHKNAAARLRLLADRLQRPEPKVRQ